MSAQLTDYLLIAASSVAVYVFMILAIRLFGKKELSQLSVIDLVFILLISNSVQNAMVGSNTTLVGGLVAATSLFLVNFLMKQLIFRFPFLGKYLQGEAVMLVYKGKIKVDNLHRVRMTHDELMEAIREHGVATLEEVDLAILEVDGNISILSHDFNKSSHLKRKLPRRMRKEG
ncbi:MAG: DUF421 domain-containing protein [Bacteroidales bacterium]|nr:DUF421 domain-containing protein [Bacteroidales bacterium]